MTSNIAWRILPFLLLLYVMSYLDRTNVAFARVPLSQDLGFSESVYGIGSGLFFIGYFLLGIPGALLVEKFGARLLVGCTAIAWGLVTVLFTLTRTPAEFYALRLLLGLSAAPFFPGVIVHIARWFPPSDRSRALAGFVVAAPVSLAVGGPLSALMLQLHGFGLRSWQWIFLLEGVVTILLGCVALIILDDPQQAAARTEEPAPWWTVLAQPNVLTFCAAYAFANIAGYGFLFWLPSALKDSLGSSAAWANAVSAIPFGLSAVVMWLTARSSDKTGERKRHACYPMLGAAFFFLLTLIPGEPALLTLTFTSLAGAFVFAWIPGFWAMPAAGASGPARAAAVGLINSVGNLGGFLGPAVIGEVLTETHSRKALPLLVASSYCAAAALVALVRTKRPAAVT